MLKPHRLLPRNDSRPVSKVATEKLAAMAARFPDMGLTLTSIIEAIALGIWASYVASDYSRFTVTQTVIAVATFVFLINVWHHILLEVLSYEYVPGFLDTILFFSTGALEVFTVESMGVSFIAWMWAALAAMGAPLLAIPVIRYKAGREAVNAHILAITRSSTKWRLVYNAGVTLLGAVLTIVATLMKLNLADRGSSGDLLLVIALYVLAAFLGYSVMLTWYWRSTVSALRKASAG